MKRIIVLFAICLVLTMVFVACNDPKVPDETTDANSTEVITTDTEAPTTEVEITEVETEVPTTEEVTETQAVTTEKVTTEKVTTEEVTTEIVTTEEVTTEEVTTEAVTTPPAPPAGGGGGGFVPPPPSGGGGGAVVPPVPTDPCANGHDEESHEAKAPTCTEVGWDAYVTCKRTTCTYTTKVEKEAIGHDKENHEAKAPTCTEAGYDAYESCKREGCDYTTKVEKEKIAHAYVIDGKKAQCSVCEAFCAHEFADGADKCKHCQIEKSVVAACEHTFADATCTVAKKCTLCGAEEGTALGHSLIEKEAAVASTCTTEGKTALMGCERCDYIEGGAKIDVLGHDEVSHEAKAPTCTEEGYEAYVTCTRCDYTTYKAIAKTSHNYVDGACSVCGTAKVSEGLKFMSNNDGTCYVALGSCRDSDIIIPDKSPAGETVTGIYELGFNGRYNIISVTIPATVKVIDYRAFEDCRYLERVIFTDNSQLTTIAADAFWYCENLTTIEFPTGLSYIGETAFQSCYKLSNVEISAPTINIESQAFANCESIETLKLSADDSIVIGEDAFYACLKLKSIEWSADDIVVGEGAFHYCIGLKSLNIPASVTSIGDCAFGYCGAVDTITVDAANTKYHSSGNCLVETATKTLIKGSNNSVIPNDGSVTVIADMAFYGCRELESIEIPSTVTKIGDNAFAECSKLTEIEIPESVTIIGESAFYGCAGITSIHIPANVEKLGQSAFSDCTELESVTFAENSKIKNIESFTFEGCINLKSIKIPSLVTSIDNWAFYGCTSLENIEIPFGVTTIASNAFYNCKFTKLYIPSSVKKIDKSAFVGCKELVSVTFEKNSQLEQIEEFAFMGCEKLTTINLPSSIKSIGNSAFCDTALVNVKIPDGVANISPSVFAGCGKLKNVYIPASVTKIDKDAFFSMNLEKIYYAGTEEQWNAINKAFEWDMEAGTNTPNGKYVIVFSALPCSVGHEEIEHEAKEPTCTEIGYAAYVSCSVCDYTTYEEKAELGHNFGGEWNKDATGHWYVCQNTDCNVAGEKAAHASSGAATETTAEKCIVCNYVITPEIGHTHNHNVPKYDATNHWNECACGDKANVTAHTPAADDGDCTTDIKCTVCNAVTTAAKTSHTPAEDDGDCTTDIKCTVCNTVTTKGNENHTPAADDGDCTTDIKCTVCNTVTTKGSENHTPAADDGDCTTAVKCQNCDVVVVEAKTSHTPAADDNNCTTEVKCTVCGTTTTAAKTHNFSGEWKSDLTGHWYVCQNTDCNVDGEKAAHVSSGAATETVAETCTVCNYVITAALGHKHDHNIPKYDETNHWNECRCGDKANVTAHTTANDDDCTTEEKCSVCENVVVKAYDNHDMSVVKSPAEDPKCDKDGKTVLMGCSRCPHTDGGEAVEKLGHEISKVDAKAATCNGVGYPEYEYCERCNYTTYDASKIIAPLRWAEGAKASIDYTSLISYGQQVFVAPTSSAYIAEGKSFNFTSIGADLTEKMYKVTPEGGVSMVIPSKAIDGGTTNGVSKGDQSFITDGKVSTMDYYVMYDDDKIYVVIRDIGSVWKDGSTDNFAIRNNYTIKFGFNPEDYTELAVFGLAFGTDTTNGVQNNDLKWLYFRDVNTNKLAEEAKDMCTLDVDKYLSAYDPSLGREPSPSTAGVSDYNYNATKQYVAYMKFEFDKDKLVEYWDTAFGTSFKTTGLPNTMFVSMGTNVYDKTTGKSITPVYYGSLITDQQKSDIKGGSVAVPHVIVLGDDKNSVVAPGCSFTGHEVSDAYRVGTTNTYYHSCIYCGAMGANTFMTDKEGTPIYEYNSTEDKYMITKASCEKGAIYSKNCSCGAIDPSGAIFEGESLGGHKYVEYGAKRATCMSAGWTAYKSCTVCEHKEGYEELAIKAHNYTNNMCSQCGARVPSDKLVFTPNGDGTCYVSALGECTDKVIVIPAEYNGNKVTGIADGAFKDKAEITSIEIPESITYIGSEALMGCTKLEAIYYCGIEGQWKSIEKGSGWNTGAGTATSATTYTVVYDYHGKIWTAPIEGVDVYYAKDVTGNTPKMDGSIKDGEYGNKITVEVPTKMTDTYPFSSYILDDGTSTKPVGGKMDYYFAYDDEYIYIAFKEEGQTFDDSLANYNNYSVRNNYSFAYGFDINDMTNTLSHAIGYMSNGFTDAKGNSEAISISDGKRSNYNSTNAITDHLYESIKIKKKWGSTTKTTNQNATGPYTMEVEMKIKKEDAIKLFNSCSSTGTTNSLDAMWFYSTVTTYRTAVSSSNASTLSGISKYLVNDVRDYTTDELIELFGDYGRLPTSVVEYVPSLIVFANENEAIKDPAAALAYENPCAEGKTHSFKSYAAKAATCTSVGNDAYVKCENCGASTYVEVPKAAHVYVSGVCSCGATDPSNGITFKAGYSRYDITPDLESLGGKIGKKGGGTYDKIQDHIYATCVAVSDGDEIVLFYTLDASSIGADFDKKFKTMINGATGVPVENIVISATHSHTSLSPGIPSTGPNKTWLVSFYDAMISAANDAIKDLSETEIYTGTEWVEGMAFVRRWIYTDGTPGGIWRAPFDKKILKYESEADNSVQIIRFVRDDKKDIVMANLQTHFTEAGKYMTDTISADLADVLRKGVELGDSDALFAVYVGASGNINTEPYIESQKVFGYYESMGMAVANAIINATPDLERVAAGKIETTGKTVTTNIRKDSVERYNAAKEASAEIKAEGFKDDSADLYALLLTDKYKAYNFESVKDVNSIISRNEKPATRDHYIGAISFGDLAFVSAPYEMFDTNGMQIKEGSPYKMTFVITNAGGAGAYVPSAQAVPNGGYEVVTAVDEFGTAERMVEEFLNMLKAHKGIAD